MNTCSQAGLSPHNFNTLSEFVVHLQRYPHTEVLSVKIFELGKVSSLPRLWHQHLRILHVEAHDIEGVLKVLRLPSLEILSIEYPNPHPPSGILPKESIFSLIKKSGCKYKLRSLRIYCPVWGGHSRCVSKYDLGVFLLEFPNLVDFQLYDGLEDLIEEHKTISLMLWQRKQMPIMSLESRYSNDHGW